MKLFDKFKLFFDSVFNKNDKNTLEQKEDVHAVAEFDVQNADVVADRYQIVDDFVNSKITQIMQARGYTIEGLQNRALNNINREEIRLIAKMDSIAEQISMLEQKRDMAIELSKDADMRETCKMLVDECEDDLERYYGEKVVLYGQFQYNAELRNLPIDEFEKCLRAGIQYRLLNRLRLKLVKDSKQFEIPKFAKAKYNLAKGKDEELQTKLYTREELVGIYLRGRRSNFDSNDIKRNIVSVLNKQGSITFEGEKKEELVAVYEKLKKIYTSALNKATTSLAKAEKLCDTLGGVDIYRTISKNINVENCEVAEQTANELMARHIAGCKSDINMLSQLLTVTYEEVEAAMINRISAKYIKETARGIKVYNSGFKGFKGFKQLHKDGIALAEFAKVPVTKIEDALIDYLQIEETTNEQ